MAVNKRVHKNHSFVRARTAITKFQRNHIRIFPKTKYTKSIDSNLIVQFSEKSENSNGVILWSGEKYNLEELSSLHS